MEPCMSRFLPPEATQTMAEVRAFQRWEQAEDLRAERRALKRLLCRHREDPDNYCLTPRQAAEAQARLALLGQRLARLEEDPCPGRPCG